MQFTLHHFNAKTCSSSVQFCKLSINTQYRQPLQTGGKKDRKGFTAAECIFFGVFNGYVNEPNAHLAHLFSTCMWSCTQARSESRRCWWTSGTQRYDIIRQRDENIKREAFVYIINLARLDNMNFSDSSTNRASSYVSGLRLAVLCVRINI